MIILVEKFSLKAGYFDITLIMVFKLLNKILCN